MYKLRSRSVPRMGSSDPAVAHDEQPARDGQRGGNAAPQLGVAASRSPARSGTRERGTARVPPELTPVTAHGGAPRGEFSDSPLDTPFEELSENPDMSSPSVRGRTTIPRSHEGQTPRPTEARSWAQRVRDSLLDGQGQSTSRKARVTSYDSEESNERRKAARTATPEQVPVTLKLSSTIETPARNVESNERELLTERRRATVDAARKNLNEQEVELIRRRERAQVAAEAVSSADEMPPMSKAEIRAMKAAKDKKRRAIDLMLNARELYNEANRELRDSKQSSSSHKIPSIHEEVDTEAQPKTKGKGIDPANFGDIPSEERDTELQHKLWNKSKKRKSKTVEIHTTDDEPDNVENPTASMNTDKERTMRKEKEERERKFKELERAHEARKPSSRLTDTELVGNLMEARRKHSRRPSEDPSDSSDSDSSSSDDSGNESANTKAKRKQRRAEKKRQKKQKKKKTNKSKPDGELSSDSAAKLMRHLDIPKPEKYDGTPDYQKYIDFVTQLENYLLLTGAHKLPEPVLVQIASQFLTGRAHVFYATEVRFRPKSFTMDVFLKGVLDACFPANFIHTHRKRYERLRQNNMTIREFARQIVVMSRPLLDQTDNMKARRLFEGTYSEYQHDAIKLYNLDIETASFAQVVEAFERLESANAQLGIYIHRRNEKTSPARPPKNNNWKRTTNDKRPFKGKQPESRTHISARAATPKPKYKGKQNDRYKNKNNNDHYGKTKQKLDELRAANKCFVCEQEGHMVRNCPRANTVPAKLMARSASITSDIKTDKARNAPIKIRANQARIEDLTDSESDISIEISPEQQVVLRCGMMRVSAVDSDDESTSSQHTGTTEPTSVEVEIDNDLEGLPALLPLPELEEENDGRIADVMELTQSRSDISIELDPNFVNTFMEDPMAPILDADMFHRIFGEDINIPNGVHTFKNAGVRPVENIVHAGFRNIDMSAVGLETILNMKRNYPLDRLTDRKLRRTWRFNVRFTVMPDFNEYLILDRWTTEIHPILKHVVRSDSQFDICLWFAIRQQLHFNRTLKTDWIAHWNPELFSDRSSSVDLEGEVLPNTQNASSQRKVHIERLVDDVIIYVRNEMVSMSTTEFEEILGNMNENEIEAWVEENTNSTEPEGEEVKEEENRVSIATARVDRNSDLESDNEDHRGADIFNMMEAHERGVAQKKKFQKKKAIDQGALLRDTSARVKDPARMIPEPIVVMVQVNGKPCRALIDTGALADFISPKLVDQLKIECEELEQPLTVHMASQGSKVKVKYAALVHFKYASIRESRKFDVMNLDEHDMVLGTPFLYQHQVLVGFNPTRIWIESPKALPIKGMHTSELAARSAQFEADQIKQCKEEIIEYARPLFKDAKDTPLPPMRAINHTIPLIDEGKVYKYRRANIPDPLRPLWDEKRKAYIQTGRWKVTTGSNAMPMMFLQKPRKSADDPLRLRTVIDLRERNANTKKLSSPLPDIEAVLRRVAAKPYRSLIDGKDAYEQIRIVPEHVSRSIFNTPDGTMVSQVMQLGDCNGGATYQSLMNHLFQAYIGVWMDIYLDDLVIYSDSVDDHVRHLKIVIDILRKEQFYLSEHKMQLFQKELKILGHIIDNEGIRMDPAKVDAIEKWKVPSNRELIRGFLGAVGYLAPNVPKIRIPMQILTDVTRTDRPFKWDFTEQRAFDIVRTLVKEFREHSRIILNYGPNAHPIYMVTDASASGIGGLISQGKDWRNARIAAFFSAKLNSAQMNYPVHDLEFMAGVKTMLRHRNLLMGTRFTWCTDHRALEKLFTQPNLSGRQARWLEKTADFDFGIKYIEGKTNAFADALSRIYEGDLPGMVRAKSEFVEVDQDEYPNLPRLCLKTARISAPVHFGRHVTLGSVGPRTRVSDDTLVHNEKTNIVPSDRRIPRIKLIVKRPTEPITTAPDPEQKPRPKRIILRMPNSKLEGSITALGSPRPRATKANERSQIPIIEIEDVPSGQKGLNLMESPLEEIERATAPQLPELIAAGEPELNFPFCLKGRYNEDSFFKIIISKPEYYKQFVTEKGLIFRREGESNTLCIPKIQIGNRNAQEIVINHAHSILAHLGARKTMSYLREQVWWKDMVQDISKFCDTCHTCKTAKSNNQKPYGLLKALPVPFRPWEGIGMDFVGPLPESKNRNSTFDTICVIIDLLTGMVHLVPARQTFRAREIAELMFDSVYKLHGLPKYIVSDRDSLFTSVFWEHLNSLAGIQLKMSSAYHPQTDGSTERANRTVTQMLRICVNAKQKDWANKLPAIEFAINNARSETTGYAPFFLNNGRMPRPMLWEDPSKNEFPGVRVHAQRLKDAIMSAHDAVLAARVKQTMAANRLRRPAPFNEGDLVYISTKNLSLPKNRARKLMPKFIGPYKIEKAFGNDSFRVNLPTELKRRGIHQSFHASLLRIHQPNDDRLFPGRSMEQVTGLGDESEEWAVERIETHAGKGPYQMFKVKWRAGDTTWLPYDRVSHLEALKLYLQAQNVNSVTELKHTYVNEEDDPQTTAYGIRISCNFASVHVNEKKESEEIYIPLSMQAKSQNSLHASYSHIDLELSHYAPVLNAEGANCAMSEPQQTAAMPDENATLTMEMNPAAHRKRKKNSKNREDDMLTHQVSSGSDGESTYDYADPPRDEHEYHDGPCSVKRAPNLLSTNEPQFGFWGFDYKKRRMFNIRHDEIVVCHRFAQQIIKFERPTKVPEDYMHLKRLIANYGRGVPEPPSPVLKSRKMVDAVERAYLTRTTNMARMKNINGERWERSETRKLQENLPSSPTQGPPPKKQKEERNKQKPARGRRPNPSASVASSSRTQVEEHVSRSHSSRAATPISSQIQLGVDKLQIRETTRESTPENDLIMEEVN